MESPKFLEALRDIDSSTRKIRESKLAEALLYEEKAKAAREEAARAEGLLGNLAAVAQTLRTALMSDLVLDINPVDMGTPGVDNGHVSSPNVTSEASIHDIQKPRHVAYPALIPE